MRAQAVNGDTSRQSGQVTWPVLSGLMPPLADSHTPRTESGLALADSLRPGETVVLVTADDAARALGAMGGTGKTQLAAAVARMLWDQRAVDLLVWVTASSRDGVLTGYAQALRDVGAPDPGQGPAAAASHFLAWLAGTGRPWLAVLDDLTDPAVLEGLWPWGASGRVMVTTNRPDTALQARSPRVVEVGPFSGRESVNYLSSRLHADPDQWIGALDLADDLGFLPIALAQAAALMADAGIGCREYRTRLADRRQRLSSEAWARLLAETGGRSSAVAATGALALEFADRLPPAGLARPMLALASMLDPNGIPGAVLTSPAACAFLTQLGGTAPVDDMQARAAVHTPQPAGPGRHRHHQRRAHGPGPRAGPGGHPAEPVDGRVRPGRPGCRRRGVRGVAAADAASHVQPGPARLHGQAPAGRRGPALDSRVPSGPVAGRAEPGQRRAGRAGHHLLARDGGHRPAHAGRRSRAYDLRL